MREQIPGVGQPPGTPSPQQRPQEPSEAPDIVRSDSYCLSRGGKVVSSSGWASSGAQVLVNMHVLETATAKDAASRTPRHTSSSGTSDSDSDSDSSDSDDTSEDEYELRTSSGTSGRPEHTHYTLAEEDEPEEEEEKSDSGAKIGVCGRGGGSAKCSDIKQPELRLPGDGHPRPHNNIHAEANHHDNHSDADGDTNDDERDDDDDDDDEDSDSESEETESTVRERARAGAGSNDPGVGVEGAAPDEDHNDTLSTLSGDLSFDDRDIVSPPREYCSVTPHDPDATPNHAPDASPKAALRGSPVADAKGTLGDACTTESRVPPEGERCTPQREFTGVFCLSGYPKPPSPVRGSPTRRSPTKSPPRQTSPGEVDLGGKGQQDDHSGIGPAGETRQSMGASQDRTDDLKRAKDERGQRSLVPFPPKYVSGHSRVAHLRGTWDSQAANHDTTKIPRHSTKDQGQPAPKDQCPRAQAPSPNHAPTRPERITAPKPRKLNMDGGDGHPQHHRHHTKPQRQPPTHPPPQPHTDQCRKRRTQPGQEHPQPQDNRRQHKPAATNKTGATSPSSSSNSRDGVRGGSDGRSPAHQYQASGTTPTPSMPRLIASTHGLGGSPLRIGPAVGVYPGLAPPRLGGSYTGLVSSASSGYGSCPGSGLPTAASRHEDSEDLSDVSSGATSEDSIRRRRRRSAQSVKGDACVSGNDDFEWVRASPMLTDLLEGHVTRLATPPDHRSHGLRTSLATPPESGEEGGPTHRHRGYQRPPPAPRPRTLEAGELVPHRAIRESLRDTLRDSRDHLYSPSRDLTNHRRSRDSSVERGGRDSSCDRASVSSLPHHGSHHHHHRHHHHHATQRNVQQACDCPSCWYDEEEPGYDSCDERHNHHRHSYHEGLHHAHLHHAGCAREGGRERRVRGHGSGDSGRSSPCCCRQCHQQGSLSSLSSHDYCANTRLSLPSSSKGGSLEERVNRLEGDKDSLQLQVTVLSEQVEAQTEKITDLEGLLEEKKEQLRMTEELLQKEVMARTSLETQRLELFSEISNMKLRQAAFDRENAELRDKIRMDNAKAQTPPPNARRKIDQFGTMPRQRDFATLGRESNHGGADRAKGVMFGKSFHFLPFRVAGKRSTSAPNLAETEMQMIDDVPEGEYGGAVDGIMSPAASTPRVNTLVGHRSPPMHPKATGIKRIFTKLRRSSSGHLESDLGDGDFRRGGMRATASARLGWTSPTAIFKEPSEPFTSWNYDTIEAWLGSQGLNQYCAAIRNWTENGHHLSRATPQQLEREIGMRHPLHRKKLQLAINARQSRNEMNAPLARLDHAWVLRWLDDVGLPQYKDAFSEARIDGRVLNCLTYDDLAFLRLTNLLHVTSLKRGIQVLREHNFDSSLLKRRSVPEEDQRVRGSAAVALWTNHRVMEWLRTVDLSEYAPNLRGSGVHGALMVYEIRFTSELLASLLSIPCGKTLLRRHLNTHFKELVGASVVQEKRVLEATPGTTPLTTSAKVKMPKKSQFSLKRKKSKSDLDFDDLLCPLDEKPPMGAMQDKERETNGDGRLC